MIEKLDFDFEASIETIKLCTMNKINEIIDWINEKDGYVIHKYGQRLEESHKSKGNAPSTTLQSNPDRQGKDNEACVSPRTISQTSQPAVCDICGKTKEEHNHQQVLKKRGINKGKLLREYFWCSENKSDFKQYKERGEG